MAEDVQIDRLQARLEGQGDHEAARAIKQQKRKNERLSTVVEKLTGLGLVAAERALAARAIRQTKLPWLPEASMIPRNEPSESKVQELPDELWTHACSFLSHDERFQARRVNSVFYRAFFSAQNTRKSKDQHLAIRVLKLAEMGRRFTRIKHLELDVFPFYEDTPIQEVIEATGRHCFVFDERESYELEALFELDASMVSATLPKLESIELDSGGVWVPVSSIVAEAPELFQGVKRLKCTQFMEVFELLGCKFERYVETSVGPAHLPNLEVFETDGVPPLKSHEKLREAHCDCIDFDAVSSLTRLPSTGKRAVLPNLRVLRYRTLISNYAPLPDPHALARELERLSREGVTVEQMELEI